MHFLGKFAASFSIVVLPLTLSAGGVQVFSHPSALMTQRVSEVARSHKKDRASSTGVALLAPAPTIASIHLHECVVADESALRLIADADVSRVDWLLRDRTNWQPRPMHPGTLAAVLATAAHFHASRIEVISGYRSPKMNEMLRKKGRHVAPRSQHPMGTAVDFRLVGVSMAPVFQLLERSHNGGVGRYRNDAFVHVDAGTRRRWQGE